MYDREVLAHQIVAARRFAAEQPNQKWIADFTYRWTAEGWLYVAAVIDLFSRRVVGWSMKAEMTAQLVTELLSWRPDGAASRMLCCTVPLGSRLLLGLRLQLG